MIRTDRDALRCDLAETYHIFDFYGLPATTLAALSVGLREDSRIKKKLSGTKVDRDSLLLASAVDALNTLVWSKTKDAQHNRNRPKSIVNLIQGREDTNRETNTRKGVAFAPPEDFLQARAKLMEQRKGSE